MSFLLKLYQRGKTDKINQLENFSSEVLCYCFQNDRNFLKDFLKLIGSNVSEEFKLITQKNFYSYRSIPDIILQSKKTIIFIESKIESPEGLNQLAKYADVLNKEFNKENKFLIFLTKSRDRNKTNQNFLKITFKNITWSELSDVIQEHDHFTRELKILIQDKIMKTIKTISLNDILALQNISNVLESYDGFLNYCADKLKNKYKLNFLKSNLKKTWIDQNFNNSLVSENLLGSNECFLWFGVYKRENEILIDVELGIYKARRNKKIIRLMDLLGDNNFKNYSDVFNDKLIDKPFESFFVEESLKAFAGKNASELAKWYDKQFEIIFNCIKQSGLKLSFIE